MALVGGLQVGGSYKFSDLLKEKKTKKKKLIQTNTLKSSKCKKHKQENKSTLTVGPQTKNHPWSWLGSL